VALDFEKLSPEELLAAESAVLTMRSLMEAAKAAPHGQGMARVESALHDKGFEHLRAMLQAAVASHEGAQKKGPAVCLAPAASPPRSGGASRRTS
jgi:hypothetical protein